MTHPSGDPARPRDSDAVIERAAAEVDALLRLVARRLRPFPAFPGAFFTEALEVEADTARMGDHGCIVVTPQGDLQELQIGVDPDAFQRPGPPDPVALRSEQLVDVALAPAERLLYGLAALRRLAEFTAPRSEGAPQSSAEKRGASEEAPQTDLGQSGPEN